MSQSISDVDLGFERDLRRALRARAPADLPPALTQYVASLRGEIGTGRGGSWFQRLTATAVSAVAAVIVVVLVWTVAMGTRPRDPSMAGSGHPAHSWRTQLAVLEADDLAIEVAGRAFSPPADAAVHSDPGSSTYRTLEMSWHDAAVEMRLYVYFAADDASWWVSAVRTYDGTAPGDWIYYVTPRIGAALGQTWAGDVDVVGVGLHGIGRLRMSGLRLSAFAAGTIPHSFEGCRAVGPVVQNQLQPVVGRINPDIPGLTLRVGMNASAAGRLLREHGICHEFRREFPAENRGQIWCSAPPGDIREWAFGSRDGGVILFVEAGPRETLPPNWPQVVGC